MEIPKMKVFIYVLTFLAYAWTGYGSSIITNLRDAVLSAETFFNEVFKNVLTVMKTYQVARDVLNDAVDEVCDFTCPSGAKPVPNKYHAPTSDGCGSYGIELNQYLDSSDVTLCCNKHDICYDTCNSGKEKCDFDLQRCMYRLCEGKFKAEAALKSCKATAKMLFTGSLTLGCKAYRDSQKKACYCPQPKKPKFSDEF